MASTDEVARAAGVGIGTVFRHFPTKDALLVAVIVNRLRRFADEARALESDDDPGRAFFTLVERAADQSAAKNAALAVLADSGSELAAETRPIMGEMRRIFATLLTRAQDAGAVRSDIGVDEVTALLFGAARAAEFSGWDRGVLARMVEVISDGLRPRPADEPTCATGQDQ
jgi:AcrR family transcriptional regulator